MASILVVDADTAARTSTVALLRELGHDVVESGSAREALAVFDKQRPDLMVVECDLPDSTGLNVLSRAKSQGEGSTARVVMIGDRERFDELAEALDAGADDVIAKPLDPAELAARVGVCLRRPPASQTPGELKVGGITIDSAGQRVFVDGDPIILAPREYYLLLFFLENRERVFTRDQLLGEVWGKQADVGARTVDVHVRRLRSLLEPYGYDSFLQTVRGSGYRFSSAPDATDVPPLNGGYGYPGD